MTNETKNLRTKLNKAMGGFRAVESCEGLHGIKVKNHRRFLKMTNVTWNMGRLQNGTEHHQWRVEISGNTFGIKEMLKGLGMKWNAQDKNWWLPSPTGTKNLDRKSASGIARLIRRELSN